MITRTFKLCLNAGTGSAPYINVSQYDEGETWLFELYSETGERYIPTTGAIVGVKSDGHGIVNTGTVDNEGRVVITETQQMTASAGRAIFELSIDGLTHGTANFIVAVERKPTDEAVMSDSDLSLIQEAIDSAEVIVEVIGDGDPSEVIGEHVDDWLDNHPEATTTVQDGAITAPKINSTLWDKLLVSEEASGNHASFEDGADDVPVSSLKVALEPIQTGSGDPSPSNVRPIYPANNRNQFPATADGTYTNSGVTVVANNGVYTVTGTSTATSYIELSLATSVDLSPATNQFAFLNSVTDGNIEFAVYRDSTRVHYWAMSPQNRVTVNWPDTGNEVVNKIRFNFQNGKTYNITISPVLCLATYPTPVTFTPYQGISVKRTGKNLFPSEWETGTIDPNTGNPLTDNNYWRVQKIEVKPNTNYYISFVGTVASANEFRIFTYDENGNFKFATGTSLPKVIATTGIRYISFRWLKSYNLTNLQLELGSTASDYEPYTGTSYPYSLGQSVYGGTVDLATGVLTLTKGFKNVTASDNIQSIGSSGHGWQVLNSSLDIPPLNTGANYSDGIICDRLKSEVGASSVADDICFVNTSGVLRFNLATVYADKTALFNALGEINVAYPIEPQTIQLTPTQVNTLLGYNSISSTGTVDVIYHADTKLYVDKMTAVDNNIIAPTEEGFTATRNYTVNDLVIVNDTLYKVTANIATGSAITPNSNVTQTTLGALIKALS